MKRFVTSVLVACLALGLAAAPAMAGRKARPSRQKAKPAPTHVYLGLVTDVVADSDPATADSLSFDYVKGNRAARVHASRNPGDITVALAPKTRVRGPGGLVDSADDLRVGDGVMVQAREMRGTLTARFVKLELYDFEGTIESYDGAQISVAYDEADKAATAWLADNGNPNPVVATVTVDTEIEREGGGDPQAGDKVELTARPSATDPTVLEAVEIEAEPTVVEPEPEPEPEPLP